MTSKILKKAEHKQYLKNLQKILECLNKIEVTIDNTIKQQLNNNKTIKQ